ncbi:methyltransferase domain-containing protein [Diaporthe amygdali]|uniref:methyltransferase domain-containing protein n=1 Tax=Phomopsis amygdali TaxID=1214568 RepID=UPI0022FDBA2B|nr:methyltransferase domain-containing protein [Diaporthe amygdali]KAJ0108961.1 methyltransferase domain-containing protein [Diaporthe amygdali]
MSETTKPLPFSLQADDWKQYLQYRPAYPNSLWHEWLEYHQGSLSSAHDLGTGCGISAASLLSASQASNQPIGQMILSDPSESNIVTARGMLRADHYPGTRLLFHQKMAEDYFLEPNSVDMVIACECLHWTDIDKAIATIHASLRPGGTLAAVFYSVSSSQIRDNKRADTAWKAFRQMHYRRLIDEKIETFFARIKTSQLGMGLDFVPLERDKWQDVKRIYINVPDGQTEWPMEAGVLELIKTKGTSRVDSEYDSFEWRDDPDGWGIKDYTMEKLKEMLISWHFHYGDKDWQSKEWRELEAAVAEGCDTFHLVFPATVILGRKK